MTNEELAAKIKEGVDVPGNMLRLWEQNRGIIGKIACRYRDYEEMEDLKQQGYIGLCQAVEGYRPEEGIPFINYAAFWIKQSMVRYMENCGGIVRIPSHEQQRQREYRKLIRSFAVQTGRKPTEWEICHCMGISRNVLREIESNAGMRRVGSLDSYVGEDGETMVGDLVPGDTDVESSVLDRMEREELRKALWAAVDSLPDRQPEVLRMRFQEGKTLRETGKAIGVSMERARVIEKKALHGLRTSGRVRELQPFLPEYVERAHYHHNGIGEFERTWTSSTEQAAMEIYGRGNRACTAGRGKADGRH